MGKKQKNSRKKKLASEKTDNRRGTTSAKRTGKSSSLVTMMRDWEVAVRFLMFVIIAIPMLGATPLVQGRPEVIRLAFLLLALPMSLILIGYKKSAISISTQPVALVLWAMVLLGLISTVWAVNSYEAITGVIKWFYVLLMSMAVYSLACDDSEKQHKIMIACALAGGYMALIGVTQYLFGHEIYNTPTGEYPWPSATSGHKNMASQFVVVTLPFALYLALTAKKSIVYLLANLLLALMLAYIVYGRARQALVALFVQILILLIAASFTRSRNLLKPRAFSKDYFYSILASLVLFVTLIFAPPFDNSFSGGKSAASEFMSRTKVLTSPDATLQEMSNGRYATWMKTVDMIRDNPAGVGLQNWNVHYPKYNAQSVDHYRPQKLELWENAHNDYLQLIAELGLPFLLIAGLMIFGLWKAYRLIWTKGNDTSRRHSLFIGMGVMSVFTLMLFSFPLATTVIPICLGIYLALLSANSTVLLSPKKAEKQVAFNPAVLITLLLLLVVGTYFGVREISAWHKSSIGKVISQMIFQPAENNKYRSRDNMLRLAKYTDEAMARDPYAPILLRESSVAYTNLSLMIKDEKLSERYREQALETALRYIRMSPNQYFIHLIVATKLKVPREMAIDHIGKAIALNPDDLQLYEELKKIALPVQQFDKTLSYYEYYIPRFFNQKMNEDYAYLGKLANQQDRVINILGNIDLSSRFTPGSADHEAAKKELERLIADLQRSLKS